MKTSEIEKVLTLILASWSTQRQRMNDDDIRAFTASYAAGLADLDHDLVKGAVGRLVRTSKFLPTVAEIREAAGVLAHGTRTTGAQAWGAVVRALKSCGSHRTPGVDFHFQDPITRELVSSFGWSELCASGTIGHAADRARFIEAYDQIAKSDRVEAQASDGGISLPSHRSERTVQAGDAVAALLGDPP